MRKNFYAFGLASLLTASLLAGCAGKGNTSVQSSAAAQKPVINFEGVVTSVDNGTFTLDNGKVIVINNQTEFAPDPDSTGDVDQNIAVGNYIQGYTSDNTDSKELTAEHIWANLAPTTGSKIAVNFEGRVASISDDTAVLEDGTVVRINKSTSIQAPDGNETSVSADDYIQGYAEDPTAAELDASSILVTAL